jgi:hypothetical protein
MAIPKNQNEGRLDAQSPTHPPGKGVAVISTLAQLESQILTWQETCIRKFRPLDGQTYEVRLLLVKLVNNKPWLRYGQHWVGAEDKLPLICPDHTEQAVLEEKRECPLCRSIGDKDDDRRASLSWLYYCFVLGLNREAITGDRRFRLHQWWVTDRVCGILFKLAERASIFGWRTARNLEVTCDDLRVSVDLAEETDLAVPDSVIQRVLEAAVSPKRRVRWYDLGYEALGAPNITHVEGSREREY